MGISSGRSHSTPKAEELEAFLPDQLRNIPCATTAANRVRFAGIAVGSFSYLFFLFAYLRSWHSSDFNGVWYRDELEGIYADAPLQTHSQMIISKNGDTRSLYSYFNSTPDDPLVQKDITIWQHDLAVGMVTITQDENAKLPGNKGSAPLHDPESSEQIDGMYLLQTTASHQMACLKLIHDAMWNMAVLGVKDAYSLHHADHCVGYLRQLVRCHPDLTPIRFLWNEEHHAYMTVGEDEHMCRSWDAVWEWSKARNTSGVAVTGNHVSLPGTPGHHTKPGEEVYEAEWHQVGTKYCRSLPKSLAGTNVT